MAAPRIPNVIAAGAAALAGFAHAGAAGAQADADARCMALPTESQQIACLREALAAAQGGQTQSPAPAPAPAAPAAEPDERGPGIRIPLPSFDLFGGGEEDGDRQARAAPPSMTDEEAFGAEQVAVEKRFAQTGPEDEARMVSPITGFEADRRGLLTLELANGQVWRQAERTGVPVRLSRSRAYTAELTESGFGGYRMQIPELNRRIVVQRIR